MSIQMKRICSMVLALIMVCGLIYAAPIEASARTTSCPVHSKCDAVWQDWTPAGGEYITEDGHYKLTGDVDALKGQIRIGTGDNKDTADVVESAPANVVIDLNGHNLTSSGRVFYVIKGSSLTIIDSSTTAGTLTGGSASGGGVIYVESGAEDMRATLNLYDATIISNCADTTNNGGAIYIGNYADVTITRATINGGKAKQGGAINVANYSVVTLNSGLITGGYAGIGGNIWLGGSTLNIKGGTISNGESHKDVSSTYGGGNIMCGSANSVINMSGGTITGGKNTASNKDANRGGGNIYLQGTMNMTGGTISSGNTTASGGNILVRGTFNMSGGTVIGGGAMAESAAGGGGNIAVRNKDGIVNISGGTITAGSVSVVRSDSPNGTFTLSGAPVISELILANNTTGYVLTANGLSKNAKIGVVAAEGQTIFAEGTAESVLQALVTRSGHEAYCPICKQDVTWAEWTTNLTVGGHYYLTKDINSGSQFTVGKDAAPALYCLDTNGYSFKKASSRAFNVYGGSTVNLFNTSDFESIILGGYTADQGGVTNLDTTSSLNLYDGITYIGAAANNGMAKHNGGVICLTEGTFNMYGGTLIGQTAKSGGAVYVGGGTFNLHDGTIQGGSAQFGGSITVSGGTFNMTGGTVTGGQTLPGSSSNYGGNMYLYNTVANISSGIVEDGQSTSNGGNIFLNGAEAKLTVSGDAVIQNGNALYSGKSLNNNYGGGNIYVMAGELVVNGGTISGGVTNHAGGNIYVRGNTTINGGEILGGSSRDCGNSIAIRKTNGETEVYAAINGGTINGGIAAIRDGVNLTISGAPNIADLNLVDYVNEGVKAVITLGNGGVTGGSITVTGAAGAITAASNYAANSAKYFHSASSDVTVAVNGAGEICLEAANVPEVPSTQDKYCAHCGKTVTWNAWEGGYLNNIENDNGHYFLTKNVTSGGQIYIGASDGTVVVNVCVDLNGHNITKNATTNQDGSVSSYRIFAVYGGSTLNLMNNAATESVVTGSYMKDLAGVINLSGASNLNLYDGVVLQSSAVDFQEEGGVICVGTGTFNMFGGTINGIAAAQGGAVYVAGGNFNMKGGLITGGIANGGKYPDNAFGGNVYINNGNFTMTGGKIADGQAIAADGAKAASGGNIYITNKSDYSVSITGGTIEGGKAINGNGGNIYLNSSTMTIGGSAQIIGGYAQRSIARTNGGGNLYTQIGTVLNITGGQILNGVCEDSYGGNILCRGNLDMTGGLISGGSAINGGNLFLSAYSANKIFNISGGTIKDGTATTGAIDNPKAVQAYDGENIYLNCGELNISGGSFSDNDGGNAVLAYTATESIPAIVNLTVANNAALAAQLDGKIYLIKDAKWTSDLGGIFLDETTGDRIWGINGEAEPEPEPAGVPGDINADGNVTNDDVVQLLWHTMFPEQYPLTVSGDINGDGNVTNDDVVLLLWHTMFPEQYPLG